MTDHTPRSTSRLALCLATSVAAFAVGRAAEAHHSFAMYDQEKTVTLTGRLTRFIPGANHAQLIFELIDADGKKVVDGAGKAVVWGVETGPAAQIAERGVTVDAFATGTVITVTLNPLRNGKTFGALARGSSLVKCGDALPKGGCTDKTGQKFLEDRAAN